MYILAVDYSITYIGQKVSHFTKKSNICPIARLPQHARQVMNIEINLEISIAKSKKVLKLFAPIR